MQTFDIHTGGHDWEKQNLTTKGVKKMYDVYKCRTVSYTHLTLPTKLEV